MPRPALRRTLVAAAASAAALAATDASARVQPPRYDITPLGPIGGPGAVLRVPYDIDESGVVVGTTGAYGTGTSAAIRWRDGATTTLQAPAGLLFTSAYGVSGTGLVAGAGHNGYDNSRALLWDASGSVIDLGTLGGSWARATGINAAGEVVGASALADSPYSRAFVYRDGAMVDLGTLPGRAGSVATSISDAGLVVGNSASFAGATTGFTWSDGVMRPLEPGPGFFQSFAYDVNANGAAVGAVVRPDGRYQAALWGGEGLLTILSTDEAFGALFATARGINNHAQVVGRSVDAFGVERAFLWEGGALTSLSTLVDGGWAVLTAEKINDRGDIIGTARLGGLDYAVLLSPVSIPTPGALSLLAIPTIFVAARRRR